MRRPRSRTIYQTCLGQTIAQLSTMFRSEGFNLTGPVCDFFGAHAMLRREVRGDLAHGLFGKTAIHPEQVRVIESAYRVDDLDLCAAQQILSKSAPAVFRIGDLMCEPTVHHRWAALVLKRADIYGVRSRASGKRGAENEVHAPAVSAASNTAQKAAPSA